MPHPVKVEYYQQQLLGGFEKVITKVLDEAQADLQDDAITQHIFDQIDADCSHIRTSIREVRERLRLFI